MNIRPDELDEEDLLTPDEYMDYVDNLSLDEL
jgi:hypothetical protein